MSRDPEEVVFIDDLGRSVYRVDGGARVNVVSGQPWSNLCASQCIARMRDLLRTLQSAPAYDQAQANRLHPFVVTPAHFTPGMRQLFRKAWAAFEMHGAEPVLDTHDLRELYGAIVGDADHVLPHVFVDAAGTPHAWFVRSQTQPNHWVSVLQYIQGRSAPENALATRLLALPEGPEDPLEVWARLSLTDPGVKSSLRDLLTRLLREIEKAEVRGRYAATTETFQSQFWTDTRRPSSQTRSPFLSPSP